MERNKQSKQKPIEIQNKVEQDGISKSPSEGRKQDPGINCTGCGLVFL